METKKSKISKKRVFSAVFSVLFALYAVFCFFFIFVGEVFFDYALDATFAAVANAPEDMAPDLPTPRQDDSWLEGLEMQELGIVSADGYALSATLIDAGSNNYALLVHGYRGQSREMGFYARKYYEEGFNVLLPDLKGHGLSEGKLVGMGYFDRLDIELWIDEILEMNPQAKIVLHGVSMGGTAVLCVTGDRPQNVACAISDCAFSNAYKQFYYVAKNVLKLPAPGFIMKTADAAAINQLGVSLKALDSAEAVRRSVTPTLFIHGTADDFVPFYMLDELYEANPTLEKEKLVIEGATHAYSATKCPKEYFEKVFGFIKTHL